MEKRKSVLRFGHNVNHQRQAILIVLSISPIK
jgi:hypothetical protein